MEVVPERRVGPFKLGMLVSVAVHELQAMKPTPHVHLTFDERGVRGLDMVLDAPDLGMRLRFEPRTQRLHLIDVYAMGRVALFYKRRHDPKRRFFCAPATLPTFRLVYDNTFGISQAGQFDEELQAYCLNYNQIVRGIAFAFPIPPQFRSMYEQSNELPHEFPDRTEPAATRMFVYKGDAPHTPVLPHLPHGSYYFEPVVVEVGSRPRITFARRGVTIDTTCTSQDLVAELGPPSAVFQRSGEHMGARRAYRALPHTSATSATSPASSPRQTPHAEGEGEAYSPGISMHSDVDSDFSADAPASFTARDYFFNYPALGVDFLLDARTHRVCKFVLHSNTPNHPEFTQYLKCNFTLRVPLPATAPARAEAGAEDDADDIPVALAMAPDAAGADGLDVPVAAATVLEAAGGRGERGGQGVLEITVDSLWPEVCAVLPPQGRPMVRGQGASMNPFGATYFHAHRGFVLEVTKSDAIASVTVFAA